MVTQKLLKSCNSVGRTIATMSDYLPIIFLEISKIAGFIFIVVSVPSRRNRLTVVTALEGYNNGRKHIQ